VALALATAAIVLVVLLSVVLLPRLGSSLQPSLTTAMRRARRGESPPVVEDYDPGRERRAEQRARELLRSCVNEEEWAMCCELGFLRVYGARGPRQHAYLVYPHKPILAYIPETGLVLGEYCVEFPDRTLPYGSPRLPDADDVLAKWVALTADERSVLERANLHLPGRQIRVATVRRDLVRLRCWERERARWPNRAQLPSVVFPPGEHHFV
jgi:hypothetical protein